jgi:hypothetical protein
MPSLRLLAAGKGVLARGMPVDFGAGADAVAGVRDLAGVLADVVFFMMIL